MPSAPEDLAATHLRCAAVAEAAAQRLKHVSAKEWVGLAADSYRERLASVTAGLEGVAQDHRAAATAYLLLTGGAVR